MLGETYSPEPTIYRQHPLRVHWVIVVATLLSGPARCDEDIVDLAKESVPKATAALLDAPLDERRAAVRRLVSIDDLGCRQTGVAVIDQTWDVDLLPELTRLRRRIRAVGFRRQVDALIDRLKAYQPIAVDESQVPELPELGAADRPSKPIDLFRQVTVRVKVASLHGASDEPAAVLAYSDDFGVRVPVGDWQRTGKDGSCLLNLFPGRWTFLAYGGKQARGLYLCQPSMEVLQNTTIELRPDRSTLMEFAGDAVSLEGAVVGVVDSRFSRFIAPMTVGSVSRGKFVLETVGSRPFDYIVAKQPVRGTAAVLHGERQTPGDSVTVAVFSGNFAQLRFEAAKQSAFTGAADVTFSFRSCPRGIRMRAGLPLTVYATPGSIEIAYSYPLEDGHRLTFARRPYAVRAGSSASLTIGGPFDCSIYHRYNREFASMEHCVTYCLFVRDENQHCLTECTRTVGPKTRVSVVPIDVRLDGVPVKAHERNDARRPFSGTGFVSSAEDLPKLRYGVQLPFAPGKTYLLEGHLPDFEKATEHFRFVGPRELDYVADSWLQGSEEFYKHVVAVLGHRPPWKSCEILMRANMRPGLVGLAVPKGVRFRTEIGMMVTQPWRIRDVAFRHELLHKFDFAHGEFMDTVSGEASFRRTGQSAARFKLSEKQQTGLTRQLSGLEPSPGGAAAEAVLLSRYGCGLFVDGRDAKRAHGKQLEELGLTTVEINCAVLERLIGNEARAAYQASGANVDPTRLDRALEVLGDVTPSTRYSAPLMELPAFDESLLEAVADAFEQNRRDEALKRIDDLHASLQRIQDDRTR